MFSIVSAGTEPLHLETLREWFLAEWNKIDPVAGPHTGLIIPAPLIAVDAQALLGGLAFTSYPIPGSADHGLWINALLVAPEHRGRGIASRLVAAAEFEAQQLDFKELFAYSSVPTLYQKLGWEELDRKGSDSVLRKAITGIVKSQQR